MELEVDDNQVLHVPPNVLAKDEHALTKIYSNFTIIPLLRLNPAVLDKQFYKPPATIKKPPALFHVLIKFLMDTKSCNGVVGIARAFLQRNTTSYLRQVNYFLVCTRPELPTPSSSDCAFFLFFAVVLKLGVMYVHNSGLPLDDTDEPIEIRCEWLASKLDNHYFPTEISTVLLKRPTNSM